MEYDLIQTPASQPVTDLLYEFTSVENDFTSPPKGCQVISVPSDSDGTPMVLQGNEGGALVDSAFTIYIQKNLCSRSKKHSTGGYWDKIDIVTETLPITESLVWPYAEDNLTGVLLVQKALASRLAATFRGVKFSEGLRAFRSGKALYKLMPGAVSDYRILQPHGRCWWRELAIRGNPDACPHCGHGPIVCPECGVTNIECEACGLGQWRPASDSKGPDDKRLILCPVDQRRDEIFNGETWDGADFISGRGAYGFYVTKRVVDFLLSIHATSFRACPVIVDAAKMNAQQRKWMDEARRMPA